MKKLNITKEAFEKSKHFQRKYGKLEYVSESGKLYKTDKGHVIKFVNEGIVDGIKKIGKFLGNDLKMEIGKGEDCDMFHYYDQVHNWRYPENAAADGEPVWSVKVLDKSRGSGTYTVELRSVRPDNAKHRSLNEGDCVILYCGKGTGKRNQCIVKSVRGKTVELRLADMGGEDKGKFEIGGEELNKWKRENGYPVEDYENLIDESKEDDASKSTLEEIKRKIEFLVWSETEATSPELVWDSLLEDPPEYKEMRNCVYEIYKLAYEASDGKAKAPVLESDGESPWFDDRGDMLKTLPGDCIIACSGQGRVDDDVAFWVDELGFANGLPRERTIDYLREYGAWDDEELNEMTEMSLAEKVLWIFCNDLKEQAYDMVGEDGELAAKLGDDPNAWGDSEWEQFQNEYGYCTLSH